MDTRILFIFTITIVIISATVLDQEMEPESKESRTLPLSEKHNPYTYEKCCGTCKYWERHGDTCAQPIGRISKQDAEKMAFEQRKSGARDVSGNIRITEDKYYYMWCCGVCRYWARRGEDCDGPHI